MKRPVARGRPGIPAGLLNWVHFIVTDNRHPVMMVAIGNTPLAIGVHPSEGTVLLLGFLEGLVGVH